MPLRQQSEKLLEAGETSDIEMKHSQDQKDVGNPVDQKTGSVHSLGNW